MNKRNKIEMVGTIDAKNVQYNDILRDRILRSSEVKVNLGPIFKASFKVTRG